MRVALVLAFACAGRDVLFGFAHVALPADAAPIADVLADTSSHSPNLVFVSSQKIIPGMLGGVDAADAKCESLAGAAGHPGHYVAWLSSSTNAAATPDRIRR